MCRGQSKVGNEVFDPITDELAPAGEELAFAAIESIGRFTRDWDEWSSRGPTNRLQPSQTAVFVIQFSLKILTPLSSDLSRKFVVWIFLVVSEVRFASWWTVV